MANFYSRTPPPLQHPIPTHPAYIPDPPSTPGSPQGYQRFSSSPGPPTHEQPQQPPVQHQFVPAYGVNAPRVSAYTSPFQHSQAQQHHPQQQNVPTNVPTGSMNMGPDLTAWGVNDTTAQFGMQLGHSAVAAGQEYVQRNFGGFIPSSSFKPHFNVSNSYVIRKVRLVLFPWMHKPWARRARVVHPSNVDHANQAAHEWAPPREDLNSPDLYIPIMALLTYVLLTAILAGLRDDFNAVVLGQATSRAFAVLLCDWIFLKGGCYLLGVESLSQGGTSASAADLIAYVGYKFVGVTATLVAAFDFMPINGVLYALLSIYCFVANAFFLLRSLRSVVLPDTATPNSAYRTRRVTFLFLEAVTQAFWMWILVRGHRVSPVAV